MELDDILKDPKKFGLPTFDEFKKNPEKYLPHGDVFAQVDEAGRALKPYLKKVIYEIEGYRCKTLEEVERVARSQGIPIADLDYRAVAVPQSSYTCDVLVRFLPKSKIDKINETEKRKSNIREVS